VNGWSGECPIADLQHEQVTLAHGGGGQLTRQLLQRMIFPNFTHPALAVQHDGAVLPWAGGSLAFTTDSYVVQPLFFPGGDIGKLAVIGTVNDLVMCGARPLFLSAGLIIEEGLPMPVLATIIESMRETAAHCGVDLVTGDTKVVERGKGDGIFINTAGIGQVDTIEAIGPQSIRPNDVILLSGDLGRHGIAIMAARAGFEFESTLVSDLAPSIAPVRALLEARVAVHCLRDLTRGGLAAALVELGETGGLAIEIDEQALVVHEQVRGACELFGFDPIYVANEGCFIAFVAAADAERALDVLRTRGQCSEAACIGRVTEADGAMATIKSRLGVRRPIDLPSGEQLPRIC
jgi:hydrogenase expression/formation protein HypE